VGDSFALFGPARVLAPDALVQIFDAPFYARGHGVPLHVRVGIAPVSRGAGGLLPRASDLLRDAAVALGHAKHERGSRCCHYTREMAAQAQQRMVMLNELRAALDFHRGLTVHYQPQIDARDGALIGAEALLRWRRDDGSMVPPDDFIPLAEYTGLIVEIGAWVFMQACDQLMRWRDAGEERVVMAVNVSALQFRQAGFVEMIRNTLDQTGVPPDRIELEITESVAMEEVDKVVDQLQALRALGVRIALDDFGCGFSSLSVLTRLPIDRLKVDRSFVSQLTEDNARSGIVQTILRLAQGAGMAAIAEGVETHDQAELLRTLGCSEMQGFLYGRPMPAEEFAIWMRQNRADLEAPIP